MATKATPIIMLSHLRWDSVFQRPHHIASRLAKSFPVYFFEEPVGSTHTGIEIKRINQQLTVITPYFKWDGWQAMAPQYIPLIKAATQDRIGRSIFWFYSPYYVHLLGQLRPLRVVYDCMDEHAAFKGASNNLPRYEKILIEKSQVVFTGGKSLYESKRQLHSAVHCFPSAVDQQHFSKSLLSETTIPTDIGRVSSPIVGYYVVIDERIDLKLIAETAALLPEVNFVMIGPVAKIDPGSLPQATNIYYLGQKDYDLLLNYLKAFTIAMMPFALNESTRYISPTKTLEYMAGGKGIISTAVRDVVRDYRQVVKIVDSPTTFAQAVKYYLTEPTDKRAMRLATQQEICQAKDWDNTVQVMQEIITTA